MTPRSLLPNPRQGHRPGLHRRVKRGIVAGYLHDLSQRHRSDAPVAPPRATPAATASDLAPARASATG